MAGKGKEKHQQENCYSEQLGLRDLLTLIIRVRNLHPSTVLHKNKAKGKEWKEKHGDCEGDDESEKVDTEKYSNGAQPCLVRLASHATCSDILGILDQHQADHQQAKEDIQCGGPVEMTSYILGGADLGGVVIQV